MKIEVPPHKVSFSAIDAGEVDANVEHLNALRRMARPSYITAYTDPPNFRVEKFLLREKQIILGQKGTGKTAVLRNIEQKLIDQNWLTEYLVFRDTVLEEQELDLKTFHVVITKSDLGSSTFYHHALKRLFICVMIRLISGDTSVPRAKIGSFDKVDSREDAAKNLFVRSASTRMEEQMGMVVDSIISNKLSPEGTSDSNLSRQVKGVNDKLLSLLCGGLTEAGKRIAFFVDELHFAYAEDAALRDDAVLVRDAILAITAINDRMARETLDAVVFCGVRSEYLTHPVIARSELTTRLEGVGERLGWETVPINDDHPLFEMARNRIQAGLKKNGEAGVASSAVATSLVNRLFSNAPKTEFLRHTWAKPRDLVRFLQVVSRLYPSRTTLARNEFTSVMRQVAIEAWAELKSAMSSFLSGEGLTKLEAYVSRNATHSLSKEGFCSYSDFEQEIAVIAGDNSAILLAQTMQMLYMVGLYTTTRRRSDGELIRHSFHRGQPSPDASGEIVLHFLVAKAFS